MDRSIKMRRGVGARRFRLDRAHAELEPIRRKLARFAADNMDALGDADPVLPPGAFNRFADNWRPLAAIADAAGGRWPCGADRDARRLAGAKDDALGHQLLEDIRTIFDEIRRRGAHHACKLASSTSGALKEVALGASWASGAADHAEQLARMLKEFEITTHGPTSDSITKGK